MHTITPQFKPYFLNSSSNLSQLKEDLFSVLPTSLPDQTTNPNLYVVADAPDILNQDSSLTKYTKCSIGSQSSIFDENEVIYGVVETPKKCQGKKLKKELKKQKIKRKYDGQKITHPSKIINFKNQPQLFTTPNSKINKYYFSQKNQEKFLQSESLQNKIQKLTQNNFANSHTTKKIHLQNTQIYSKSFHPCLNLTQLDEVKTLIHKQEDFSSKQSHYSEQTVFIQERSEKDFDINNQHRERYFIDDLIQEANAKNSIKSVRKSSFKKLNFIQTQINLLENYQIPIENVKPQNQKVQKLYLTRRSCDNGKKTLLIDLDDTLIFTEKPLNYDDMKLSQQNQYFITQNDGKCRKLFIRPYARQFIQRMNQNYEIMIFTAATKSYAQQIRAILDPENSYISHVLDRQHCFNPNIGNNSKMPYIKDLRRINRPLNQTILLDNSIFCFWYQIYNGIPITSYTKIDQNDNQLYKVAQYLQTLVNQNDVRIRNKQLFKLQKFQEYVDSLTLVQELYIQNYEV